MPTTIKLDGPPIGITIDSAREGESVRVQTRGFVTTEDGDALVDLLEQISDAWLSHVPGHPPESTIDHAVFVFRRDGTAQVFVNEVPMRALIALKVGGVQKGDPVGRDAVADTHRLTLDGVDVPGDAGILVVLSVRWRRGVLYDFSPLSGGPPREPQELERMLAAAWTYLSFQDRVGLRTDDWDRLTSQAWFPFIGLPTPRIKAMVRHARAGWAVDDLLPTVIDDVHANLPRLRRQIENGWLFEKHQQVFLRALEHFERDDYLSTATMLYPRIEGLLREQHALVAAHSKATQAALASSAVTDPLGVRHELSLLVPERFRRYIEEIYFAGFDPTAPSGANRNTIGHGVAPEAELGQKAAVLGILIAEQLAFLCRPPGNGSSGASSS